MSHVIAIDLGSNSIRFLEMDCTQGHPVATFHRTVKTADGLAQTGQISPEAVDRVVDAIIDAKSVLGFDRAWLIRAVTTEAIRQASNGDVVLQEIFDRTQIRFDVIDGEDEARYARIATEHRLRLLGEEPKSFLIADIGGGSTELIFSYGDRHISKSFKIGIVTLTQSHQGIESIRLAIPKLMQEMRSFTQEVYAEYGKVELFVAMAGTPTTVAAMKLGMLYETYDPEVIHGTRLSRQDLTTQMQRLLSMPEDERTKMVGVGREDLIASGILIYDEIYEMTGFEDSIVIDDGVREGVAYATCKERLKAI